MSLVKNAASEKACAAPSESASQGSLGGGVRNLWQHPYVDVFKHFKVMPNSDWKLNKRQGNVSEEFAKEIGRKILMLTGSISANNYIQIPSAETKGPRTLGLSGRYVYLQMKQNSSTSPFSFHIDLNLAERSTGIRISGSNLYKTVTTQNGFVLQLPINLNYQRWSVVVLDLYELLQTSGLLPATYLIEGSYQIKSIMLCAASSVRGIFTSDNLYDFVTLPPDMRFKFSFEIQRWPEQFTWLELPADYQNQVSDEGKAQQRKQLSRPQTELASRPILSEKDRVKMDEEIKGMLADKQHLASGSQKKNNLIPPCQNQLDQPLPQGYGGDELLSQDEKLGFVSSAFSGNFESADISKVAYIPADMKRSPKLQRDPVMELRHVIGYAPDHCLNLQWSRIASENIAIFSSGGALVAMSAETDNQQKFFLGHSAPIVCFDVCAGGALLASAQEGKNSIVRVWDYASARCLTLLTMPVNCVKCLAFSPDGRFLAVVGKDTHNKEVIAIWDIGKVARGEKPELFARQTSDFNILSLKFSPIDNKRLVSCGKENIRFWRVRDGGNIRGSAVVLNQFARNTVFTALDFEWGARTSPSASVNPDAKENESLKRVYVASKSGIVFQINYHNERLEATYRTNDAAIYSIAVNEAFCVTGSEDQYLRVWPLDFSEFFMEAKHEGTVCSVDISTDGLRVLAGTLAGSIGVLDKGNQRYRTLVRAHTDRILALGFHAPRRNLITVSGDGTIRLWDTTNTFSQVVEFSSPIDQPICVAGHPVLPIFACGFKSGTMRIFDIEKTCVADEFTQFNKPLRKLAYSPDGSLLVTCCEDGSVALHNVTRQHLPTKMMHLEFPPQFVHVSFTPAMKHISSVSQADSSFALSSFALVGENGSLLNIYDSATFLLRHQIQVGGVIMSFEFAQTGKEIAVVLKDQRIRFFSLSRAEGVFLRELSVVHREAVHSIGMSQNGGYLFTAGEDRLLKAWDYDAQKNVPYFFQAFIGHTFGVEQLLVNPCDASMLFTKGDQDGVLIWRFNGDTSTNFMPQPDEGPLVVLPMPETSTTPTVLEQMRTAAKARKQVRLPETSFVVSAYEACQKVSDLNSESCTPAIKSGEQVQYEDRVQEMECTMNHYVHLKNQQLGDENELSSANSVAPKLVGGYEGFGGVHDNLEWDGAAQMIYTLNNKVIIENSKTREQIVLSNASVRLSCLARNRTGSLLASGEGQPNSSGNSYVFIFELPFGKLVQKLTFHQKGVQALAFTADDKLISVGVASENALALWDLRQGLVLKSVLLPGHSTNQVVVDHRFEGTTQFVTIGAKGNFTYWRIDEETGDLQFSEVELPEQLKNCDFTCATFTPHLSQMDKQLLVLGTADGALVPYDPAEFQFYQGGIRYQLIEDAQIGALRVQNNFVVLVGSNRQIIRYPIGREGLCPPGLNEQSKVKVFEADGAIISLALDEMCQEAILGTSQGSIFYCNFKQDMMVRLISRVTPSPLQSIGALTYDSSNPHVMVAACCGETGQNGAAKLLTSRTLDQVLNFHQPNLGAVAFLEFSTSRKRKLKVIGYSSGYLKLISTDHLTTQGVFKLSLLEDELITAASFNPSAQNLAVGTSFGAILICSFGLDSQGAMNLKSTRLSDLQKSEEIFGVTSLQLSDFDPLGTLTAAFENGNILTWQNALQEDQLERMMEKQKFKKQKSRVLWDLSEMSGQVQFDQIDKFDLFENPHGLSTTTQEDKEQLRELYGGKRYKQCGVTYAPGSAASHTFICYVSALQYLFVRNFSSNTTERRVPLMQFPSCVSLLLYSRVAQELEVPVRGGGMQILALVGTQEGQLIAQLIADDGSRQLCKTEPRAVFGQVASVALGNKGIGRCVVTVGSSSGEVIIFDLADALIAALGSDGNIHQ